jgi:nitric oxide reductase NorD protein
MTVHRYSALASAIAARRLDVTPTDHPASYTDGRTIFVAATANADDVIDLIAMQAALLAGGSLQKHLMARLARHRGATSQRYLALEIHRVTRHLGHVLPRHTLQRMNSFALHTMSPSAEKSLQRALQSDPVPTPPAWVGTLEAHRFRRVAAEDLRGAPTDGDRRLRLDEQASGPDDDGADDDSESLIVNLLSTPKSPNPFGDALQRLLGMSRGGAKKQEGSAEIPVNRQRFGRVGANAAKGPLQHVRSAALPSHLPNAGTKYPEWNCHRGAYHPNWCTVVECDPADDGTSAGSVIAATALKRQLAQIGNELQRHRRQSDGDGLDFTALVDYQAARWRGETPDTHVYENDRRTKRDLSVLVLLDCSGSTSEAAGGQVVFEEERRLATDLTVALEALGDRVATYGFYSRGKDAVRFLRVKEFSSRFDHAAKQRLAALRPVGFTRIGAAIRHGTHVLESGALAKNMVLLVIGDGHPYDDGYEGRYARADARQAIREATLRGVGAVGVGVRSSTEPEVLEDIWLDASFRVIDRSADLQRHLQPLILNALSLTRGNGRRPDLSTEEHQNQLRSLSTTRRRITNSYQ